MTTGTTSIQDADSRGMDSRSAPASVAASGAVSSATAIRSAIVVGFAVSVAQLAIAYVTHLPAVSSPPQLTVPLLLLAPVVGGFLAARGCSARVRIGALTGGVALAVSLIGVLSKISADVAGAENESFEVATRVAGSIGTGFLLGAIGGALRYLRPGSRPLAWGFEASTRVWIAATFFLLVIGGVVTSAEAGMAVYDWPTSEGSNMWLYPLKSMTRDDGIFYEHSHRLVGTLVGLVTLLVAAMSWTRGVPRSLRVAAFALFLAVVVQGYFGGRRVTEDSSWGETLRVVHGVFGQLVFSFGVVLAVSAAAKLRNRREAAALRSARFWAAGIFVLLCGQLALGAMARHVERDGWVHWHLAFGLLLPLIGAGLAFRVLDVSGAPGKRLAIALGAAFLAQPVLGFVAFALTAEEIRTGERLVPAELTATAHQGLGAAILGLTAAVAATAFFARRAGNETVDSETPPTPSRG